jgi:hypothetical protein
MFAARLLLGEFVTGYEVSGGVNAPKGTPVEVIETVSLPHAVKGRGERVAHPFPIFRIRMVIYAGAGDEGYCSQTRHDGLLGRILVEGRLRR